MFAHPKGTGLNSKSTSNILYKNVV